MSEPGNKKRKLVETTEDVPVEEVRKVLSWKLVFKKLDTDPKFIVHNLVPNYICPKKDYDLIGTAIFPPRYLYTRHRDGVTGLSYTQFNFNKARGAFIVLLNSKSIQYTIKTFGQLEKNLAFITKSRIVKEITASMPEFTRFNHILRKILKMVIPNQLSRINPSIDEIQRFYSLERSYHGLPIPIIINCNTLVMNIYNPSLLKVEISIKLLHFIN